MRQRNEINRFTVNGLITFTLTDRDIKEKILLISYQAKSIIYQIKLICQNLNYFIRFRLIVHIELDQFMLFCFSNLEE